MKYLIVIRSRVGEKGYVVPREFISEETAINVGMHLFREGALNRILIVDGGVNIVFKQERRCKCSNVQQVLTLDGLKYVCMDCKIVIDHEKFKEYVMEKYGEKIPTACPSGK